MKLRGLISARSGLTSSVNQYIAVLIIIALTVLFCRPLANQQGHYIVSFILLFEVSVLAIFLGIGPILLASTVSSLVWNYFFIPPHFQFHIEKTEDKLMFVSFFFIALINGVLTNRIRRQEKLALEREERTKAIFELTRDLSEAGSIGEIVNVAFRDAEKYFHVSGICILHEEKHKIVNSGIRGVVEKLIDPEVASWVLNNSAKAGKYTHYHRNADLTYYPLTGKKAIPGVMAVLFLERLSGEKEIFWNSYLTQISNALEREQLSELAIRARLLDESDKLYKTLFTLISHEFRIPIATIMGASDSLMIQKTGESGRKELINEIFKASSRLNHLVENLLNMSRLESEKISVHIDWCDVNDLFNKVISGLSTYLEQHQLLSTVPDDMPLVKLDFGLMEQVIYNLVLNSCLYSQSGSVINLEAMYSGGNLYIVVSDNGPGFSPEVIDRIFEKFFRADTSRAGGLGLGLSIVKGLVEAHRGTVSVSNIKSGGAEFRISIPTEIPDLKKINPDYE